MHPRMTTEQFITKSQNIHGTVYDYSRVIYTNAHTKVNIMCNIHGEFSQRPNVHLSGSKCPGCAHNHITYSTHKPCTSKYHTGPTLVPITDFYSSPQTFDKLSRVCKECHKTSSKPTKEAAKRQQQKYYAANRDRIIQQTTSYSRKAEVDKRWRMHNPGLIAASTAKRRAAKLQATPKWAVREQKQIQELYLECQRISLETGIPHQVDHIVPLQAVEACGLHCLSNLRIITQTENASRKNQLE